MANSTDPDQLASEEANWSGSTLFAKSGYIQVWQDKGLCPFAYLLMYLQTDDEQSRPWWKWSNIS